MDDHGLRDEPTYSVISYPSKSLPAHFLPFVLSKWLHSLKRGNPLFKAADTATYYLEYDRYIKNLLAKPDSTVRLAVLTDDHDVVLGFAASREDVLDYIFVHKDYKGQGIASKLFPSGITTISHITKTGIEIWHTPKYKHLKFNPFA